MAAGYAGGWSGFPGQDPMAAILEQAMRSAPPAQESPQSLQARYGTAPETVDQWNRMNGYSQPQVPAAANPAAPAPQAPAPAPGGVPAAANPTAPAPSSGGGYADFLNEMLGKARAYNPMDAINAQFDAVQAQGVKAAGLDANRAFGQRGTLPSDPTSQDLHTQLLGNILNPIATARAGAVAGAQGDQMRMLQGLLPGFQSLEQMNQQRERDAYQRTRDSAEDAWRRERAGIEDGRYNTQQQWQNTQQQWQREDRTREQQPQASQGLQLPSQVFSQGLSGGGGMDPAAAAALAKIYSGSGGRSAEEVLGGSGGTGWGSSGGGGGTSFLPSINAGSNAGLYNTPGGGTTWHNPANAAKPYSQPGPSSAGGAGAQPGAAGAAAGIRAAGTGAVSAGGGGAAQPGGNLYQPKPRQWGTA